jgi:predicted N-formylglutamate amidohydrolase
MTRFDTDRFSFRPVLFKIFAENVALRMMHASRILPARLGRLGLEEDDV